MVHHLFAVVCYLSTWWCAHLRYLLYTYEYCTQVYPATEYVLNYNTTYFFEGYRLMRTLAYVPYVLQTQLTNKSKINFTVHVQSTMFLYVCYPTLIPFRWGNV